MGFQHATIEYFPDQQCDNPPDCQEYGNANRVDDCLQLPPENFNETLVTEPILYGIQYKPLYDVDYAVVTLVGGLTDEQQSENCSLLNGTHFVYTTLTPANGTCFGRTGRRWVKANCGETGLTIDTCS